MKLYLFVFVASISVTYAQTWEGSPTSTTTSDYNTATQITHLGWGANHGILFNAYRSPTIVNGPLYTIGNTKNRFDAGPYSSGAGAIMYLGNGGRMDFFISGSSSGAGTDVDWGGPKMSIARDGKVGFGTFDPTSMVTIHDPTSAATGLEVFRGNTNSLAMLLNSSGPGWGSGTGRTYGIYTGQDGTWHFSNNDAGTDALTVLPNNNTDVFGYLHIRSSELMLNKANNPTATFWLTNFNGGPNSPGNYYIKAYDYWGANLHFVGTGDNGDERLNVTFDGKVGIGTTTPQNKLDVNGTVHAKEVKVDLDGFQAPDYVFEKDYPLTSLSDLQTYIDQNKHLPEIPSAKEMEEKGINLKEMNLLLLKKVEELTLHIINQEKRIQILESNNPKN